MKRLFVLLCYVSLTSCQDKVICSAYQSTFILDDSTRRAYYSYVWQLDEATRATYLAQQKSSDQAPDTLGVVAQPATDYYAYAGEKLVPWRTPKRTKYGVIKPVWRPIKNYQLRTAPMENVLAPEPVSNEFVASDFTDSLAVDSLSMDSLASKPTIAKEEKDSPAFLYDYNPNDNFNVEQLYYNKYFSHKFIDNRPKPKPQPLDTMKMNSPDTVQSKKPFFKQLFKKKEKQNKEEEDIEPQENTPQPDPEQPLEESEGNGQ